MLCSQLDHLSRGLKMHTQIPNKLHNEEKWMFIWVLLWKHCHSEADNPSREQKRPRNCSVPCRDHSPGDRVSWQPEHIVAAQAPFY